ncbi:MAG: RusA family crossover junction endodeoxyribonuclease [Chromatiales bacterium]|nr:RusA family crossover junction endodeoxyribonuclease [Chromatiales bacterium]MCK7581168.1 RusA family crossover junction endodeoxyribonuclease [Chromatiales bacterium]
MPGAILLPYPVGSNRLWRNAKGRTIVSPEALAWKQEARLRAQVAGVRPIAGPVAVALVLHPRLTVKGRASETRLDVDAPIKPTLDALQGVAYANDKQVVRVQAVIGEPIPNGGLSVSISGAD